MKKIEDLKQYSFVIKELVGREIKRKYARSYLGILWSVLNPLLSMTVLSMIFSTIFKRSIENFPIYYLTGMTIWQLFTGATSSAMTSLVDNQTLLLKVKLPKQVFILARVYTALVNFMYSFIAYILMLIVFRVKVRVQMLGFPIIILLLLIFAIGISYLLAVLYVFFGDIKHLYSVILTLWMYMSALFYPIDTVSESLRRIILVNPIYSYIATARGCMMYGQWPTGMQWTQMGLWAIGSFSVGALVFYWKQNDVMQRM
ncbi:MAG: ABC transporter permease [bacterium]|nr:ABC transporter permease [bacterium]